MSVIQTEAQALIAYLNRAGLVGAMEGQSAVWADALDDIRFVDAQAAAKNMVKTRLSTERWVTPGDVRAEVSSVRKRRLYEGLQGGGYEIAPPDTDDTRVALHWSNTFRDRLADGHDLEAADALACEMAGLKRIPGALTTRPVAALVAQAANTTKGA